MMIMRPRRMALAAALAVFTLNMAIVAASPISGAAPSTRVPVFEIAPTGSGGVSVTDNPNTSVSAPISPARSSTWVPSPAPVDAYRQSVSPLTGQRQAPSEFPAQQCCGGGNGWAPGDTNVAVGPNYVVEIVNASLTVYSRSTAGTQLSHTPVKALAHLSNGDCIDVTVIYWSWDSRFAFGCTVLGASGNTIVIAVSRTANPTGSWYVYQIHPDVFLDQPSITATADKMAIGGEGSNGYEFYILQKSTMLTGQYTRYQLFRSTRGPYRATVHITNEFDAKFVSVSGSNMWMANFTGAVHNVHMTEVALEAKSYSRFSDVAVPGGKLGNGKLDNRPLMAQQELESRDNHYVMVVSTLDQCGSNLCAEISRVDFSNGNHVSQQWHRQITGYDTTYPAVTLDGYGDVFLTYTWSGPTLVPQAVADAFSFDGTTLSFSRVIHGGTPGTTSCDSQGGCDEDWGDYNGAAQDPTNSANVWVASEYQLSKGRYGWGTAIAQADYTRVH